MTGERFAPYRGSTASSRAKASGLSMPSPISYHLMPLQLRLLLLLLLLAPLLTC